MDDKENPLLVVFGDNLSSVKFMQDGIVVNPRYVLRALAAGTVRLTYSQESYQPEGPYRTYVTSETWTVVPNE